MGRWFLFLFGLFLTVITGILGATRQAEFEKFMLVQTGARGSERIIALDPASNAKIDLTETYDEIALRFEHDGWLYYWGENALNQEALYRQNIRENDQQIIVEDAFSRAFVQISLRKQKVVYIRQSGELAIVNLDGTENQDIELPDNIQLLKESYASFNFSQAHQTFHFAAQQADNVDVWQVALDDYAIVNLTQHLATPHKCINYYWFENLELLHCDDIYYYRGAATSEIIELLPASISADQRLAGIEGDDIKFFYVIDAASGQIYQVELDTQTGDWQYSKTELPIILARGADWEIIRKQTDTHFEMWHIQGNGTETHIFSTDLVPALYKWRDGNYLLMISDVVLNKTDIYRVDENGLDLEFLYHSDDLFLGLNYFAMDERDFYFAEAVAYNPRVYELRSLKPDGTLQTYSQWPGTNRFYDWTDIFVREWSSMKWLAGIGLTLSLGMLTAVYKHGLNNGQSKQV